MVKPLSQIHIAMAHRALRWRSSTSHSDGECHCNGVLTHEARRVVAAQVEFENKVSNRFIIFLLQALSSRRFQRGSDRVNLHRPTGSRTMVMRTAPASPALYTRYTW